MKHLTMRTAIFALLVFILCSCGNIQDYDYYFRDNDDFISKPGNGMDESGWVLGDEFRSFNFSDKSQIEDITVPSLEAFSDPYIWAKYDEEHQVIVVSIEWWKENTVPLTLYVWPEQPEQDDPYYYDYWEDHVTTTKTHGCVIIGSGTPTGSKRLNFALSDGTYCQISAPSGITTAEMGEVLDFLLENGFRFSPFDYDSGQPIMS